MTTRCLALAACVAALAPSASPTIAADAPLDPRCAALQTAATFSVTAAEYEAGNDGRLDLTRPADWIQVRVARPDRAYLALYVPAADASGKTLPRTHRALSAVFLDSGGVQREWAVVPPDADHPKGGLYETSAPAAPLGRVDPTLLPSNVLPASVELGLLAGRPAALRTLTRIVPPTVGGESAKLDYEFGRYRIGDAVYFSRLVPGPDGLPAMIRRYHEHDVTGGGAQITEIERVVFSNWSVGQPIGKEAFAWSPPPGTRPFHPTPINPNLLPVGRRAPDIAARNPAGKTIRLSEYRGHVVVLDFWASWCQACQQSFPHTARLASERANDGVVALAVDSGDDIGSFRDWLKVNHELTSAGAALQLAYLPHADSSANDPTGYGVDALPVEFVIGRDGRIAAEITGYYDYGEDLDDAVAAALAGRPAHPER
jgi:peroxiredoxin